jgi:hypothetical protein
MRYFDGLAALIGRYGNEEEEGWILLEDKSPLKNASSLMTARFIVADDEDEEDALLDTHPLFLEIPTFFAVVDNEREASRTSVDDIAAASFYYLKMDTFRD